MYHVTGQPTAETEYLALRGKAGLGLPSLLFCFAGARSLSSWLHGFRQALTAGRRSGLDGIRGASYALDVPAKQKRVRCLSGIRDKLQVKILAHYPFHGFGDLAVQPSLKPR
jgi:hypothetical protein